jgi:hypothetical protein
MSKKFQMPVKRQYSKIPKYLNKSEHKHYKKVERRRWKKFLRDKKFTGVDTDG